MSRSWRRSSTDGAAASRRLLVLAIVACALPVTAASGAAQDPAPADLRERALSILTDPRYQREMPFTRDGGRGAASGRQSDGGGDLGPFGPDPGFDEVGGGDGGRPAAPELPSPLERPIGLLSTGSAAVARAVLYVLAGVAVVLVLLWVVRLWSDRRRPPRAAAIPDPAAVATAGPAAPGGAGPLLAAGRYAEAIHHLLLYAIRRLAERFRLAIPASRTSREILALLPLRAERRDAFADLVCTVERSLFGGAPVGREDYERSLAQVRLVLGGGVAA